MRSTGQAVSDNADKLVRRVAVAVDRTVVLATPVKTGRARLNWQVGVGSAVDGTLAASEDPSGNTQASLNRAASTIVAAPGGSEIHITNNLPYIGALNDGTSAQAPANFVLQAVQAGVEEVARGSGNITTTSGRS